MKTEICFALGAAAICAAMLWCMAKLDDPFYACASAFTAAFWGSMAAFCVWGRICERQRKDEWPRPTVIMPNRRRG